MKITVSFALICASVTACGSFGGKSDARLDGVWESDRERTLANIRASDVSEEQLRFLRQNLGRLRICFREDKTAAFFDGMTQKEITLVTYRTKLLAPSSITVETSGGVTRTLHLSDGCFRHAVPGWKYEEYFCRRFDIANPCG